MGSSINFLFYFHITIYKSIDEYEKKEIKNYMELNEFVQMELKGGDKEYCFWDTAMANKLTCLRDLIVWDLVTKGRRWRLGKEIDRKIQESTECDLLGI